MATASPPPAPYVFLSYASRDRARALVIADQLEAAGVRVWVDRRAIAAGASWGSQIVAAIKGCAVLVLVCTEAALQSKNVRQEIQLAWSYDRPYLPLLLERVTFPEQVRYWLEGWQWVEVLHRPADAWLPDVLRALTRLGVAVAAAEPKASEPATVAGASATWRAAVTGGPMVRDGLTQLRPYAPFSRWSRLHTAAAAVLLGVLIAAGVLTGVLRRAGGSSARHTGDGGINPTAPSPLVSAFTVFDSPTTRREGTIDVRDRVSACFTLEPLGATRPLVVVAADRPAPPRSLTDRTVVARSGPVTQTAGSVCVTVLALRPLLPLATYWVYLLDGATRLAEGSFTVKPRPEDILVSDDMEDATRTTTFSTFALTVGYTIGYDAGEYVFKDPGELHPVPGALPILITEDNVAVAVDVRLVGDSTNLVVAVGCRLGPQGGYNLQVSPANGTFSIARIEFGIGGGIREVPLIDWRPSEAIVRGTGTNRLLLRCAGTTLTAMVNGAYLATVEDTADLHGAPFVYAGARINQSASSDARFDNLLVVRQ